MQWVVESALPWVDVLAKGTTAVSIVLLLLLVDPVLALSAGTLSSAYGAVYLMTRKTQTLPGIQRHNANADKHRITAEVFGGIKDVKVLESGAALPNAIPRSSSPLRADDNQACHPWRAATARSRDCRVLEALSSQSFICSTHVTLSFKCFPFSPCMP